MYWEVQIGRDRTVKRSQAALGRKEKNFYISMANYRWRWWCLGNNTGKKLNKQDTPGKHLVLYYYFLGNHLKKYSSFDTDKTDMCNEQKYKEADRETVKDRWAGKRARKTPKNIIPAWETSVSQFPPMHSCWVGSGKEKACWLFSYADVVLQQYVLHFKIISVRYVLKT